MKTILYIRPSWPNQECEGEVGARNQTPLSEDSFPPGWDSDRPQGRCGNIGETGEEQAEAVELGDG